MLPGTRCTNGGTCGRTWDMNRLTIRHDELSAGEYLDLWASVWGTDIFVELCAMPDKIPFYEKSGFSANEARRLRKNIWVTR